MSIYLLFTEKKPVHLHMNPDSDTLTQYKDFARHVRVLSGAMAYIDSHDGASVRIDINLSDSYVSNVGIGNPSLWSEARY